MKKINFIKKTLDLAGRGRNYNAPQSKAIIS
jgi:hypothetical protein